MATAKTIDLTGRTVGEIELPAVFDADYRPDLIKKAVLAAQANRLQSYGPSLYAGMKTSATGWGSGRGVSHVPRLKNSSRAARVPHAKGGRRAHPPKPEADRSEKVNTKERRYAIRSAIAATIDPTLVNLRGHIFEAELPIVAVNDLENLERTKQVIEFLEAAGLYEDVLRAKYGRHIRAGRGKLRGRKYKHKKSVLIVTGENSPILKAARNLSGVDVVTVDSLNAELLAPGTHAGRLTVWTESAIGKLEGAFQ
ncbi:50S ribosomal protein L4 [Methanosarcina mazei]|uniref:Large ribosomal subunit protein uL4 n=1 Tax=Methanosarcina mazei TaxID=2209 RepID=A0A0F8N5K3_METMZ|nr:50S ribosomal protein L4 [Methanosarcina mazei]KKG85369.1 50S ribosomal protein L4 [Methanosarcina mazei]KKG88580.1 50S ribosomal protein L4 [Methanosarcina mazei]KKH13111.1 50S ribosomal protein L4 [Methanosarcina mazei]